MLKSATSAWNTVRPHIRFFVRYLLILFLLFGSFSGHSQAYIYKHLGSEQGLPNMTVYEMFQDEEHYLWLGTSRGIYRYNGVDYKSFAYEEEIGSKEIFNAQKIGSTIFFSNLLNQVLHVEGDSVKRFQHPAIDTIGYLEFCKLGADRLVIVSCTKAFIFDLPSKQLQTVDFPQPFKKEFFTSTSEQGAIFTGSGKDCMGVTYLLDKKGKLFHNPFPALNDFSVQRIFEINGRITARTLEGFAWLDTVAGGVVEKRLDASLSGCQPFKKKNGPNFWLSCDQGFFEYNFEKGIVHRFFNIKKANYAFEDCENNLWCSVSYEGLYVFPGLNGERIMDGPNRQTEAYTLVAENMQGGLIAASSLGKVYSEGAEIEIQLAEAGKGVGRSHTQLEIDGRKLDFIAFDGYISIVENGKEQHVQVGLGSIKEIGMAKEGLYIASNKGLSLIPKSTLYPIQSELQYHESEVRLCNNRLVTLAIDSVRERMFFATMHGLFCRENNSIQEVSLAGNSIDGVISNLHVDQEGVLWLLLQQNDLIGIENGKEIVRFDLDQFDPRIVCTTLEKKDNRIYVGTNWGVQVVDLNSHQVRFVDRDAGLISNQVLDLEIIQEYLYVGTAHGVSRLPLKVVDKEPVRVPLHLIHVEAGGKKITQSELSSSSSVYANHQNTIGFQFEAVALNRASTLRYKYRLLGLDSVWHEMKDASQGAWYHSLAPGDYEFQVQLKRYNQLIGANELSYSFSVSPPYWQTWWFRTLVVLSILVMIAGVFIWVFKGVKKRGQMREALIRSKLSAMKAQVNPHFVYNTLNALQEFIIDSNAYSANQHLAKFARLLRNSILFSEKEFVFLHQEIETLELYLQLEKTRLSKSLTWEIELEKGLQANQIQIPPLLIRPFVENAIKQRLMHLDNEGRLKLKFQKKGVDCMVVTIWDNGRARPGSDEKEDLEQEDKTIFITQRRLDLLHQFFTPGNRMILNHEVIGDGTQTILSVPILNNPST